MRLTLCHPRNTAVSAREQSAKPISSVALQWQANNRLYLLYQRCCLEHGLATAFWLGVVDSSFVSCPSLPWLDPQRKTIKTGSRIHGLQLGVVEIVDTIPPLLEMTDPDIILYLYPNDGPGNGGAVDAIYTFRGGSRYMPPRRRDALEQYDIYSRQDRESTEQPEEQRGLESSACIVLRFSDGAKTRLGVVAGCAPNVDLPFEKQPGISRFHLAFTFDDKDRPIARDLGSLCGTRVIYDGEEGKRRSNFDYLLQGPRILGNKPPVLNVTGKVQFKVVVPPRDITSQDYINRVARFRQGTADHEDLFASLVLRSAPGTQPPTGTDTPSRLSVDPVLYKKKLGEGAFGVVTYVWNATTGEEYALKEPLEKFIKSGQVITKNWKKEAEIMGRISHVSAAPSVPNILTIALYLQPADLGPYCRVSRCHILPLAPVDL